MESPPIHYAKTSDGASIAYWVLRNGPSAMVHMPAAHSHLRNEWELPEIASWYERLSSGRTLIAYDAGGMGMSELPPAATGIADMPPGSPRRPAWADGDERPSEEEAAARQDLEAVLTATGAEPVTLLATWMQAWVAMRFAADFPERVSGLVLWGTSTRGSDMWDATAAAVFNLVTVNPRQWAKTVLSSLMGWSAGDAVDRYIQATGMGGTHAVPESRSFDALKAVNHDELASSLEVPTLVLHSRHNSFVSEQTASRLAATIPNAQLVVMDGESLALPFEVADQALEAINTFIPEASQLAKASSAPPDAGSDGGAPPYPAGLSAREVEVLRLLAGDLSNPEIAERLVISRHTVVRHLNNVYTKIGVSGRAGAAAYVIAQGLLEDPQS